MKLDLSPSLRDTERSVPISTWLWNRVREEKTWMGNSWKDGWRRRRWIPSGSWWARARLSITTTSCTSSSWYNDVDGERDDRSWTFDGSFGTKSAHGLWNKNNDPQLERERERESKPMIRSDIPRTIAIQCRHSLDMKTSSQTRLYTHTRHCQCAETPVGGSQPLTGSPVSRLYAALPTLFSPPSGAADLHRINDTSIPSLSQ